MCVCVCVLALKNVAITWKAKSGDPAEENHKSGDDIFWHRPLMMYALADLLLKFIRSPVR